MSTLVKSVVAACAVLASLAASAQPFTNIDISQIDARQARQEHRIERGIARGEFTRHEARMLRQGQREIARAKERAQADGHIDRGEMRHLNALLDQADVRIRELRHNDRHPM